MIGRRLSPGVALAVAAALLLAGVANRDAVGLTLALAAITIIIALPLNYWW
ncbi:MAG: hypothetical protein ACE5LF_00580 [Alphaproteobacteria bacterium]